MRQQLVKQARWKPRWNEEPEGIAELLAYVWLNGDPAVDPRSGRKTRPGKFGGDGESLAGPRRDLDGGHGHGHARPRSVRLSQSSGDPRADEFIRPGRRGVRKRRRPHASVIRRCTRSDEELPRGGSVVANASQVGGRLAGSGWQGTQSPVHRRARVFLGNRHCHGKGSERLHRHHARARSGCCSGGCSGASACC